MIAVLAPPSKVRPPQDLPKAKQPSADRVNFVPHFLCAVFSSQAVFFGSQHVLEQKVLRMVNQAIK
jgi:hypothetical protein